MKAFVVGFPKAGTQSLRKALASGGIESAHWRVPSGFVGEIIYRNIYAGHDPFAGLEEYQAITQADVCVPPQGKNYWPNLDFSVLALIRARYPECLFLLNYREPALIADSMQRWNDMAARLRISEVPGLPKGFGGNTGELVHWIENHYAALRSYFADDPNYREIDIAADDAGAQLGAMLGVEIGWWGRINEGPSRPARWYDRFGWGGRKA